MMNVIKTAIITIVISIISGLLLEYFKNVAPRILCSIGKGISMEINNKKVYAYSIAVSNLSKKTIHDLTLNIQSSQSNLKMADAKITKGLKFDYSINNDNVEVDIPFLSKGDKFSVTVYVENKYGLDSKPTIVLRSPENFKKIDSTEKNGILSLFNTDDTENTDKIDKNNKPSQNKKVIIAISSIIVFMVAGILLKYCFQGISTDSKNSSVKTHANEKFNDETRSSENGTNKNTDIKVPIKRKTKNIDKNIDQNKLNEETHKNTDTKKSINEVNKNIDINVPTNKKDESTDAKTKASKGEAVKNKDEGTKNSDTKTLKQNEGRNENINVNEKTPKDGENENKGK